MSQLPTSESPLAAISPLAETKTWKNILGYGPPGKGKTWFATRVFGTQRKRLIIDGDRKFAESVKFLPGIQQIQPNISVWMPTAAISGSTKIGVVRNERFEGEGTSRHKVHGTEAYIPPDPRGYNEIVSFINALNELRPFPYEVVVLDTLTSMSEHLEALILNHHKVSVLSLPLFGVYKRNMIEWKGGFLSLPCHRVALAHDHTDQDELTKEIWIRPSIIGSYREEIGKDFSEVYYFLGKNKGPDGKEKYLVRTSASRRYMARTTLPGLKDEEDIDVVLAALEKAAA